MSATTGGTPPFPKAPIFDLPELQNGRQRFMYSALTLTAWLVWGYLWLPLITAIGWLMGVRVFVREIVLPDSSRLVGSALLYLVVIVVLAALLIAWSRYHVHRFRGKERRTAVAPISDGDLRSRFGISEDTLSELRNGESVFVSYDASGRLIETGSRTSPARRAVAPGPGHAGSDGPPPPATPPPDHRPGRPRGRPRSGGRSG